MWASTCTTVVRAFVFVALEFNDSRAHVKIEVCEIALLFFLHEVLTIARGLKLEKLP